MAAFRLTSKALRDVAEIITYRHRNVSSEAASDLESRFFRLFQKII